MAAEALPPDVPDPAVVTCTVDACPAPALMLAHLTVDPASPMTAMWRERDLRLQLPLCVHHAQLLRDGATFRDFDAGI